MQSGAAKYQRLADERLGLRCFRPQTAGAPVVLGLPYAGGQSLGFRPLAQKLPPRWGVYAIDPPGHGWAQGEPLESIEEMVDCYARHLPDDVQRNAILVGHSLGGYVAHALAQRLATESRPPAAVVLCASRPPTHRDDYESFVAMDDEQLIETLIRHGGMPPQWAEDREAFEHFRGALLTDLVAFEKYAFPAPAAVLPWLALGGSDDWICRPEHVRAWPETLPGCDVEILQGDHMLLHGQAGAMAASMEAWLRRRVPAAEELLPPG